MAIIRITIRPIRTTGITGRIRTMATMGLHSIGMADIDITTATIIIGTITGITKLI
jgi:hypothetical protein